MGRPPIFSYLAPFQRILDTEPLPWYVWPLILRGSLIFSFVVEAEKLAIRLRRDTPQPSAVPGSGTA